MNAFGKGIMIASAVATLVASGSLTARAADKAGGDKVHCSGINSCKGTVPVLVAATGVKGRIRAKVRDG